MSMHCIWDFYCGLVSCGHDATLLFSSVSVLSHLQEAGFKLKHQRKFGTDGAARSWRPEMPHFHGNQWSGHLDRCLDQYLTLNYMGLDRLSRSKYFEVLSLFP